MGSDESSGISFPDFVKVAEAHGIPSIRLDSHLNLKDNIQNFLEDDGMGICELMLDHEQDQSPKAINRRKIDGTSEPTVFEDMYPFLDEGEVKANMLPPISGKCEILKQCIPAPLTKEFFLTLMAYCHSPWKTISTYGKQQRLSMG
jgi:hypothetical protein